MFVLDREADENGWCLELYLSIRSLFSGETPSTFSNVRVALAIVCV
jgi:hypothetical protein